MYKKLLVESVYLNHYSEGFPCQNLASYAFNITYPLELKKIVLLKKLKLPIFCQKWRNKVLEIS